jgi:hypothetical protein
MAIPQPRTAHAEARVMLAVAGDLGDLARSALRARGVACAVSAPELAAIAAALDDGALTGMRCGAGEGRAVARALADACERAARAGRPLVILAAPLGPSSLDRGVDDELIAHACLRARGAVITTCPDTWIEALALLAQFGVPAGPAAAIVAPPGSYLDLAAAALAAEDDGRGRASATFAAPVPGEPVDVVLHDGSLPVPEPVRARALRVVGRWDGALGDAGPTLVGVRPALAAVAAVGRVGRQLAVGLGPAPVAASRELDIDHDRLERQLGKLASSARRVGDHETKVLLAAYGVATTRQAVATTPSAALRLARRAGFPVELRRWGDHEPTERAGAQVERQIANAADVRRAYQALLGNRGDDEDAGDAVIVRETPPPGREVRALYFRDAELGWFVAVEVAGVPAPAAAAAPLRQLDAQQLARHLPSTRAGEAEPDREALANLLRRASHLVVDLQAQVTQLELARVVVSPTRTLVVDAALDLARR